MSCGFLSRFFDLGLGKWDPTFPLFFYIKPFPCLRREHGDPLFFLSLPVFAFAQLGIIFFEVTMAAGAHDSPPCERDPLML